jgi:hypothetical protein
MTIPTICLVNTLEKQGYKEISLQIVLCKGF